MTMQKHWRNRKSLYRLEGAQCLDCGRVFYPPAPRCIYCGSGRVERRQLSRRGTLLSYSIVYSVSDEGRKEAPVIVGLVDLGDARVIAEVTDADPGEVQAGMQVEAVLRRLGVDGESGVIYYGLKFRPALGAD